MHAIRRVALALFACFLLPLSLQAERLTSASDARFLASLQLPPAQPMARLPTKSLCSADCLGAGTASCSGSSCDAVDRNCSLGQQGYAHCGSTYSYCNACPGPGGGDCQSQCEVTCGGPGFGFCIDGICNCV
jgi:hypothetical protein